METMDTRNMQTVEIEKLNEKIADDRQMLRLQDDSINKLLRICRGKDATIDEQRAVIHVMSGGHGERIIADNETLKAKLVDVNRRFNHVVKFNEKLVRDTNELFAERNTIIEELKSKLIDKEQQLNEAHKLLQDMTSHGWKQSNEITSMKISHGKERKTDRRMIKELEAKLAVYDSSKQEVTGLNFDGVDDCIEILPHHTIDEADIPKGKWVRIISAYGMGEDITIIHDVDVDEDYIHDAFCSVECPLCGSRKIVVTIEGELEKIRCKECGKTALKHLKRGE